MIDSPPPDRDNDVIANHCPLACSPHLLPGRHDAPRSGRASFTKSAPVVATEELFAWSATPNGPGSLTSPQPDALSPAAAQSTPLYWRSCGVFDRDDKLVKAFPINRSSDALFLCGRHSNNEKYGYRHMVANKARWEALTPGTTQTWRDIADLAMSTAAWSPLRRVDASGGLQCRDVTIHLYNLSNGRKVRSVDVRMYVRKSDWRISTVIPGGWCP